MPLQHSILKPNPDSTKHRIRVMRGRTVLANTLYIHPCVQDKWTIQMIEDDLLNAIHVQYGVDPKDKVEFFHD